MKIGIMSDSHDHIPRVDAAIKLFREHGAKNIIHCGDIISPFIALRFKNAGFDKVYFARGNNDGEILFLDKTIKGAGEFHKPPVFLEIGGLRFAILHEPMPDNAMAALPVDAVCYGHTHDIDIRTDTRPVIINPGECCGWLRNRATVALLDSESLKVELIDLP